MDSKKKILLAFIAIADCIFLAYFAVWIYYGRLHFDDIEMLGMVKKMSIGEFVKHMYIYRSGRFFAYGLNWCIYRIADAIGFYWIFPLIVLLLGYVMCWFSVNNLIPSKDRPLIFLAIVFIYNIFVMANLDCAQLTWLCAMIGYLTIPSTLLLASLIARKDIPWYLWPVIVILVVNLGTKETYAPILLFFIAAYILWQAVFCKWRIRELWSDRTNRRMIIVACAFIVLLVIVVVAPGNYVRLNGEESDAFASQRTIASLLISFVKSLGTFAYFMAFNIPYLVVVFLVMFIIGHTLQYQTFSSRSYLVVAIVYAVYVLLSIAPIAFLFGGFGYKRNYTHLVFVSILFVASMAYMLGTNRKQVKPLVPFFPAITGVSLVAVAILYHIVIDLPTVRHYAERTDERMEYLADLQSAGNTETIYIPQLPIPYTTNIKYDVFKLLGREKNPQPVLYYIPDQPNRPDALGRYIREYYGYDYDIILDADHFVDD